MCVCVGGFCLCATQPDFVIKGMETGCDVCVCWGVLSLRHPARLCYQRYGNWLWCVCVLGDSVFAPPSQTLLSKVWKLAVTCLCVRGGVHPSQTLLSKEAGCDMFVCEKGGPPQPDLVIKGSWLWHVCVWEGGSTPARPCYQRKLAVTCLCVRGGVHPSQTLLSKEAGCDMFVCEGGGPPQPDLVIKGSWLWHVCVWEGGSTPARPCYQRKLAVTCLCVRGGVHPSQTLLSKEAGCDMVCVWGGWWGGGGGSTLVPSSQTLISKVWKLAMTCGVGWGRPPICHPSQTLLSAVQCSKLNYIWLNAGFRLQLLCLPPDNTVPRGGQIEGLQECDCGS